MKKPLKWLVTTALVLAALGGATYGIHTSYQPLLFAVDGEAFRQDDWNALKPEVFNGVPYTRSDEVEMLKQRSLEELVLGLARQMNVSYDQAIMDQQLSQFGTTPEERAAKLAEMNTTEAKVRSNYERALTAFALKAQITSEVKVSDEEIAAYYEQNKDFFFAPEFRSVHYIKGETTDTELADLLKGATDQTFPKLVEELNDESKSRAGAWHELDSHTHLISHTTQAVADSAFKAPVNRVMGPIQDGGFNFWYLISEIKEPRQFTLMEERNKIHQILLQDKQVAHYREWLDSKQDSVGYVYFPENLDRAPLSAFWSDLTHNFKLFF